MSISQALVKQPFSRRHHPGTYVNYGISFRSRVAYLLKCDVSTVFIAYYSRREQ